MPVTLAGGRYSAVVDPAQGGAVLSASWRSSNGTHIAVLEPMTETLPPFKAGCFVMAPFANRIADGRFHFEGQDFAIPVNDPTEGMAIHGFSRENPWKVVDGTDATLILEQEFRRSDNPWRYHARQEIGLSEAGIRMVLTVRNDGAVPMPFGIGLHPWFPKTQQTTLSFQATGALGRDERGLPVGPIRPESAFAPEDPAALGGLPWFDAFFEAWYPQRAEIIRPEDNICIELTADGAFRHLQVYVPDNRMVVCAEPVSHAPDAINRPQLPGAMQVVLPGEELSGIMTIRASSFE